MGEGPRRLDPLLLVGDRGGLDRTDPDRQVPLAVDLLEQHDRLVAGQLDPNPDHAQLAHYSASVSFPPLPERYTRGPGMAPIVVEADTPIIRRALRAALPGPAPPAAGATARPAPGRFRRRVPGPPDPTGVPAARAPG